MSNTDTVFKAPDKALETLPVYLSEKDPEEVLLFAKKASKALMSVIASKDNKVLIKGEQYLTLEDWQTLARFYNITTGIEWTKSTTNENKAFGYDARAVAYQNSTIISGAEASCFRDEKNWEDKPSFQLKSMSQTRAMSKCLRNILAWIVVLSNFKPTPAEEITETLVDYSYKEERIPTEGEINNMTVKAEYDEWHRTHGITQRQEALLKTLIVEKVEDEDDRESRLANLEIMTKSEASELIGELLS
ncbi:MAG: hypothetical protein WC025_01025 [Candidatus Magasanikbacteria bacterium]